MFVYASPIQVKICSAAVECYLSLSLSLSLSPPSFLEWKSFVSSGRNVYKLFGRRLCFKVEVEGGLSSALT